MAILVDVLTSPWTLLLLIVFFIAIYDPLDINWVPGPLLARFSQFWLFYHARRHRRYLAVHAAHARYGKFVRVGPNHVSVADADAIPLVYGHNTGTVKSEFYDAFVSMTRGLFNSRDRAQHTRKRKIVSSIFSNQNVAAFEPYVQANIALLMRKLGEVIDRSSKRGFAEIDFLPWANYIAFDIIGDLAFGRPFGFLEAESDTNDAIEVLNKRGEWSATVGTMVWIKPWTPYIFFDDFFPNGLSSVQRLARIAVDAVEARLKTKSDRRDLLSFLIAAKDAEGEPLPKLELYAEALTQLIAGSDTTSNSLAHFIDTLTRHPLQYARLRRSIDACMNAAGVSRDDEDGRLASWRECQQNVFLQHCIKESLRVAPTSALGLPRQVPEELGPQGLYVCGRWFKPGTVLSVPSYTVHRDPALYPDPYAFNPDRWAAPNAPGEKQFVPFSYGPRGCIGRNVAWLELETILSNLLHRYRFDRLEDPALPTPRREGFLLKPTKVLVRITRRTADEPDV